LGDLDTSSVDNLVMSIADRIRNPMDRRTFLQGIALTMVSAGFSTAFLEACASSSSGGTTAKTIKPVLVIRDLIQQNSRIIQSGGLAWGKTASQSVQTIVYNNDSNIEISSIQNAFAAGGVVAMNSWTNSTASVSPIMKAAKAGGHYVVTQWNKPDSDHPWNWGDTWVSHISFDTRASGKAVCSNIFKLMGGQGGFCAIQGLLDATNAQQWYLGVQDAMKDFPGIKLLAQVAGDWDDVKAFNATQTWVKQYGDQLKYVWAANDGMALGALNALQAAGKAGKVYVSGGDAVPDVLNAIKAGTFTATARFDTYWQGAIGLALAYAAASGKITPSKEPHEHREFNGPQDVVTKENVDKYLVAPDASKYDFNNPWQLSAGPIT
jgi:ribose transport system substrate-binding protein